MASLACKRQVITRTIKRSKLTISEAQSLLSPSSYINALFILCSCVPIAERFCVRHFALVSFGLEGISIPDLAAFFFFRSHFGCEQTTFFVSFVDLLYLACFLYTLCSEIFVKPIFSAFKRCICLINNCKRVNCKANCKG